MITGSVFFIQIPAAVACYMEIFHVNLSNPCSGILKSTCNTACTFWDSYEKFKKAGAEVVGITGDDSSSHKALPRRTNFHLPC
ncbi:thioredoxin-dependent peroxiredoxin [Trifolium repens]|nr:thioredoxin-dependent peroxiredoxin [Trifolium repens]